MKDWAGFLAGHRNTGKTRAISHAAKEFNGVVVAGNHHMGELIEQYGAKYVSVHSNPYCLSGIPGPILFDTDTVRILLEERDAEIQRLKTKLGEAEARFERMVKQLGGSF